MFHVFVKYWRGAAADAAALGLGGDISCTYYGVHIELPDALSTALDRGPDRENNPCRIAHFKTGCGLLRNTPLVRRI